MDEVLALYERHGGHRYDELLSQTAHAEQTAALATAAGSDEALPRVDLRRPLASQSTDAGAPRLQANGARASRQMIRG